MATKTTKTDAVLKLLGRQRGATVAQLRKATGWQPHSVRAALTGLRQEGPRHPAGAERKGRHRLHDRRTMNRHADEDRIAGELSAIPGLTRGELIGLWEKAHGRPPPKGLSRRLLEYSAAYRVQVKASGGLKAMVRRKLRAGAASGERTSKSTPAQCRSRALSPGTRLVREWHGVPHTVEVLEKGFFYDSKTYRSLSRIAHVITGARWSGPRFFGL